MDGFIKFKLRENLMLLTEITVNDAWKKFYSDKTKFPVLNGNEQLFNSLNDLYPKNGDNFNKGIFNWLYNLRKNNQLKDEDFYKVKEYLRLFYKFINKVPQEKRDLNRIKSLPDLYSIVQEFEGKEEDLPTSKTQEIKQIKEKELKKVYEDDKWSITIPLTERASCLIGKGTQWCTSADKSENAFESHNNKGPLYVIINKDENTKYQLHFETSQLMDEKDQPISGCYFFEDIVDDNDIVEYFKNNLETTSHYYDFIIETSLDVIINGGYCEEFYDALTSTTNIPLKEKILDELRSSSDEDTIYNGFIFEDDPYNISDHDVENLLEYYGDNETLDRIIEHLVKIGYKSKNDSIKKYLFGRQQLNDHNLELNKTYKIDKGRKLMILTIDYDSPKPKYRIQIGNDVGYVNLETLLNYLHHKQLFEHFKLSEIYNNIIIETKGLKSKSAKGNRYFEMLKTGKFQHYDSPKGELSTFSKGEEDRKRLITHLSNEDKKTYREWLKTPEGQKSLENFK